MDQPDYAHIHVYDKTRLCANCKHAPSFEKVASEDVSMKVLCTVGDRLLSREGLLKPLHSNCDSYVDGYSPEAKQARAELLDLLHKAEKALADAKKPVEREPGFGERRTVCSECRYEPDYKGQDSVLCPTAIRTINKADTGFMFYCPDHTDKKTILCADCKHFPEHGIGLKQHIWCPTSRRDVSEGSQPVGFCCAHLEVKEQ